MADIREASVADAEAIHNLLQESWGESLLFDVFHEHIASPTHQIRVAVESGEVVGFVSAFLVPRRPVRWEVDLILVRAESRGCGIGTTLIKQTLADGVRFGAGLAKASIRVDNVPSQRAFSKAGFTADSEVRHLLLWDPLASETLPDIPQNVHLIPVNTLLYQGVWIEGDLAPAVQHVVIQVARGLASQGECLNTGMFTPARLKATFAPDLLAAATDFGQYHWWHAPIR